MTQIATTTYWENNGKYQLEAERLNELMPMENNTAGSLPAFDAFIDAAKWYHDLFNNGLCNLDNCFAIRTESIDTLAATDKTSPWPKLRARLVELKEEEDALCDFCEGGEECQCGYDEMVGDCGGCEDCGGEGCNLYDHGYCKCTCECTGAYVDISTWEHDFELLIDWVIPLAYVEIESHVKSVCSSIEHLLS